MAKPASAALEVAKHHGAHEQQSFWTKYVFSQDHKTIGLQYGITALLVGAIGMVMSWVMRLQLGFPGVFDFIHPTRYYQFMTQHGMIMVVYLLTALLLGGFGNYLIPLMIGARDMAFPFLNMLSFWTYFASVIVLFLSFIIPGGMSGAGWTLYPPQSITSGTPGSDTGITLMLVSIVLFVIGATMGGVNYVTTILQLRTQGMTLMRMPMTIWGLLISAVVSLLAFPALFVAGIMLFFDKVFGASFFMPQVIASGQVLGTEGGSPLLYQHLFWFFGHPEVYIVALPVFGMISDIIAAHARKPIFGYRGMVVATAAIGGISFIVWAHHMFTSGMNPYFGFIFATATVIVAIPTALKVYNWLFTLWKARIRLTTPMLFAIGFISSFLIGGLTGLWLGNVVVNLPLHDTYFVVGHFHLVMGVSAVFGIFAGIYHWFPKFTGRMLNDSLGKLHFAITYPGTFLIFFPMLLMGIAGVPRRYFNFAGLTFAPPGLDWVNTAISVVALIVGAAQLIFVYNIISSLRKGRLADKNPWQATTLEWQTPDNPPQHGNWGPELPVVYRGAYEYSVPGAPTDFIPQNAVDPAAVTSAVSGNGRDVAASQEGGAS